MKRTITQPRLVSNIRRKEMHTDNKSAQNTDGTNEQAHSNTHVHDKQKAVRTPKP